MSDSQKSFSCNYYIRVFYVWNRKIQVFTSLRSFGGSCYSSKLFIFDLPHQLIKIIKPYHINLDSKLLFQKLEIVSRDSHIFLIVQEFYRRIIRRITNSNLIFMLIKPCLFFSSQKNLLSFGISCIQQKKCRYNSNNH